MLMPLHRQVLSVSSMVNSVLHDTRAITHQQMNVTYKKPADKLSEYIQDILVIENYHVTVPFCLPLFANGTPTLLFHTAQGQFKKKSGNLTLFGQTILPDKLQLNENF